jgi:DnaJ-class molecular chaperone
MPSDGNPEEVPDGTPGSGEDTCRTCEGTGQVEGKDCPDCGGSGKVTVGIGGG